MGITNLSLAIVAGLNISLSASGQNIELLQGGTLDTLQGAPITTL